MSMPSIQPLSRQLLCTGLPDARPPALSHIQTAFGLAFTADINVKAQQESPRPFLAAAGVSSEAAAADTAAAVGKIELRQ